MQIFECVSSLCNNSTKQHQGQCIRILSKAFHLPSNRTISQYTRPGSHDPDGIQWSVLKSEKEVFESDLKEIKKVQRSDSKKEYDDPSYIDFLRQGSLAFDSKKIKEKVIFDTY